MLFRLWGIGACTDGPMPSYLNHLTRHMATMSLRVYNPAFYLAEMDGSFRTVVSGLLDLITVVALPGSYDIILSRLQLLRPAMPA